MNDWLAPSCLFLTPERAAMLGGACVVLAVLVVATIVLGFGPLRAWRGLAARVRARAGPAADCDGGLLGTWRLYRQVGHSAPRSR